MFSAVVATFKQHTFVSLVKSSTSFLSPGNSNIKNFKKNPTFKLTYMLTFGGFFLFSKKMAACRMQFQNNL